MDIWAAAEAGNLEVLRELLADPSRLEARKQTFSREQIKERLAEYRDLESWQDGPEADATPLIVAAAHGHLESVGLLVAAGADLKATDALTRSALDYAILGRHSQVVDELFAKGAKLRSKDALGVPPLTMAIFARDLERARDLLRRGASAKVKTRLELQPLLALIERLPQVENPLHVVVYAEEPPPPFEVEQGLALARELVAAGADVTHPRILEAAIGTDLLELWDVLVDAGADPTKADSEGKTALRHAVSGNARRIAERLLDQGHDPNAGDGSILLFPVIAGDVEMVRRLLAAGVDIDEVVDDLGETALIRSADRRGGNFELLSFLAEAGAALDIQNYAGKTALDYALEAGDERAIECLRQAGADAAEGAGSAEQQSGPSPAWRRLVEQIQELPGPQTYRQLGLPKSLEEAAARGDLESIDVFLEQGAAIEGGRFASPLRSAVARGQEVAIEHLLARGATFPAADDLRFLAGVRAETLDFLLGRGFEPSAEQLERALLDAVRDLDVPKIRRLLELGASPTEQILDYAEPELEPYLQGEGDAPEGLISKHGRWQARLDKSLEKKRAVEAEALELVNSGALDAELDIDDAGGLLYVALACGLTELADALLTRGAGVNISEDFSALAAAASLDDLSWVKRLLDVGADPDGGDSPALVAAAELGRLAMVECLLAAGADPTRGRHESTPARAASGPFRQEIKRALAAAARQQGRKLPMALAIKKRRKPLPPERLQGVAEFLARFEPQPDWTVLAAEAAIDDVSPLLAEIQGSTLTIDVARKGVESLGPESFVLQLKGSSWTIEYRALGWHRTQDGESLVRDAAELSKRLSAQVVTFAGLDVSGLVEMRRFQDGSCVDTLRWLGGEADPAQSPDAYARSLDLFVPPASFEDSGLTTSLELQAVKKTDVQRLDHLTRLSSKDGP